MTILILWMRKMRLWKVNYLAQDCKLEKEVSRVWTQRVRLCPRHYMRLDLYPCGGLGPQHNQCVGHATGRVWEQRSVGAPGGRMAERNRRWGSLILNCRIPRHDSGGPGNADALRETGRTHGVLWPLAAFESEECLTRMWSQMPDFLVILQGLKMSDSHYFTFLRSAFVNPQKYIFLMYLEHLSNLLGIYCKSNKNKNVLIWYAVTDSNTCIATVELEVRNSSTVSYWKHSFQQ